MEQIALIVGLAGAALVGLCVYLSVTRHRARDKIAGLMVSGVWACARDIEEKLGDASVAYAAKQRSSAVAAGADEEDRFWQAMEDRLIELHHIAEPLSIPSILNEPPTGGPPPGTIFP